MVQALERENAELRAKIPALQEKAIKDNDAANARLTLILQSLSNHAPNSACNVLQNLEVNCVPLSYMMESGTPWNQTISGI